MAANSDSGDGRLIGSVARMLDDAYAEGPGPAIPWALLAGLDAAMPTTEIGWFEADLRARTFTATQSLTDGGSRPEFLGPTHAPDDPAWRSSGSFDHAVRCRLGSQVRPVVRASSLFAPAELRRLPFYDDAWQRGDVSDVIVVSLPAPRGIIKRLGLWRSSGDRFTATDEAVAGLLLPHLVEIERWASRQHHSTVRLTARQWQVLDLAATGASNAQIAGRLCLSVGTVRKHFENIFDATGARSRTGAIAVALPEQRTSWTHSAP